VYDPVSYETIQYRTETDQWEFVRPCIVLKLSVSYWNGTMGICTTLIVLNHSVSYWNGPMGMCTTLYRTKTFSIVLKRTNGNVYDPVSYSNFQYRTETDQWVCVRPCIVLNHSVSYWNGPMEMCTTLYRTHKFSIVLKRTNGNPYDHVSY